MGRDGTGWDGMQWGRIGWVMLRRNKRGGIVCGGGVGWDGERQDEV